MKRFYKQNKKKMHGGSLSLVFLLLALSVSPALLAQPKISSFSPASGPVGTTVTITGSGFNTTPASNTVYLGGIKVTPSAATATSLTVKVPAGTSYQPVTVTTGGLTAYSKIPFNATFGSGAGTPSFGSGSFSVNTDYAALYHGEYSPSHAIVGDLDGDGKPDLVTVNTYSNSPTISVFSNTNDTIGIVSLKSSYITYSGSYPNGVDPAFITMGDLDGDGKPDLVIANSFDNSITILLNTSTPNNISFSTTVYTFSTGSGPVCAAIGDLNGDGKPDVVTVNNNYNQIDSISVLQNTSSGPGNINFAPKADMLVGTPLPDHYFIPMAMAIGDLDGDGNSDLAVASQSYRLPDFNSSHGYISLFQSNSTPGGIISFAPELILPVDSAAGNPTLIAMGDLDGDGKQDLIVKNTGYFNSNTGVSDPANYAFSIFRNTSTGSVSFATEADFQAGNTFGDIAVGDLDGDGKPDLALNTNNGYSVSVLKNKSTPDFLSFSSRTDFGALQKYASGCLAIGDLDMDGQPDLVMIDGVTRSREYTEVSVLKNQIGQSSITSVGPIIAGTGSNLTINGYRLTGATGVSFGGNPAASYHVVSDSLITAVVGSGTSGKVSVAGPVNTAYYPGFTFTSSIPIVSSFTPQWAKAGDAVIITGNNFDPGSVSHDTVYFGAVQAQVTATSATQMTITVPAGTTYQPVTVNRNSLIGYSSLPFQLSFGGSGINSASFDTLVIPNKISVSSSALPMITGDLNGDGKTDVIIGGSTVVSVLVNTGTDANGRQTYARTDITGFSNVVTGLAVGDLDGDGKPELVVVNGSNAKILVNTTVSGTMTFGFTKWPTAFNTNNSGGYVPVIADMDGDGKNDLVLAKGASSAGNFCILRNTSTGIGNINFDPFITLPYDFFTQKMAVGDVDGDGRPDIVTPLADNHNDSTVYFYHNSSVPGQLVFGAPASITTGKGLSNVIIGDVNGDGKMDLIIANQDSHSVPVLSVLVNTGTMGKASFAPRVDLPQLAGINNFAIGDLDGDGKPDLAVTAGNSSGGIKLDTVYVLRNLGNKENVSFASPVKYQVKSRPGKLAIGDMDGDGKPEMIVLHGTDANGDNQSNWFTILHNKKKYTTNITFGGVVTTYGATDITPVATSNNTDYTTSPITYTIADANVATMVNGKVHATGAGTTTITASQAGNTVYDPATDITQSLVVNKADPMITITAFPATAYGQSFTLTQASSNNPEAPVTYTTDNTAIAIVQSVGGAFTLKTTGAGTVNIIASQTASANYNAATKSQSIVISKATLTITADNKSKLSGSVNPTLTASYSGFVNGDDASALATPATISTTAVQSSPDGTYPITASGAASPNYAITFVPGTLTVGSISFNLAQKKYGDADFDPEATSFVGGSPVYSSSDATVATIVNGNVHIVGAGQSNLTVIFKDNNGVVLGQDTQLFTVSPVQLTITAHDTSKIYGSPNPSFRITYSGFVNGDQVSSLAHGAVAGTAASASSGAGTYAINADGATSQNYTFTYIPATLTVTPAPLTITANNLAIDRGNAITGFTATYTGFMNSDNASNLAQQVTFSCTATSTSPKGPYAIVVSGASSPNYTITFVNGILTMGNNQLLTFAALPVKTYGDVSFDPGASSDQGGTPVYTSDNTAVASIQNGQVVLTGAGTANITATFAATGDGYAGNAATQALTVNKKLLTISTVPAQRLYGQVNPVFQYTYNGFAYGENNSVLLTQPVATTTAGATSPVADYAVKVTYATAANYDVHFADGKLTVTKAPLTIKANDVTTAIGDPIPPFTLTYTGFVNGEGVSVMSSIPNINCSATSSSPAGTYTITLTGGSADNYAITLVNGTLTITLRDAIGDVQQEQIRIYPNPSTGAVYIALPSENSIFITVLDMKGDVVKQGSYHGKTILLDLSGVAKGLYMIRIEMKQGVITKRVMIQ